MGWIQAKIQEMNDPSISSYYKDSNTTPTSLAALGDITSGSTEEAKRRLEQAREELRQGAPASVGQLQEIDLGPDAVMRNITRTQEATRKLEHGEIVPVEDQSKKKIRLGRNGRPFSKKRKPSEGDVMGKLVEEVLKEHRREFRTLTCYSATRANFERQRTKVGTASLKNRGTRLLWILVTANLQTIGLRSSSRGSSLPRPRARTTESLRLHLPGLQERSLAKRDLRDRSLVAVAVHALRWLNVQVRRVDRAIQIRFCLPSSSARNYHGPSNFLYTWVYG